jgi:hypothetical protein
MNAQHDVFRRTATMAVAVIAICSMTLQSSEASPSLATAYGKVSSSTGAMRTSTGAAHGPSQCVQQANNPHRSDHYGWMSAEVTANCRAKVIHMYHTAQLWENRWWGGEKIGVRDTFDKTNVKSGAANAHEVCIANDPIWVTGEGYVVDTDGHTYDAATESNHITNPCSNP